MKSAENTNYCDVGNEVKTLFETYITNSKIKKLNENIVSLSVCFSL